ncbi:MAG: efflux RND transporter permease subunit [Myxococcales bacterium]|nr:efflux RND transporter permease subunit [Myxococcales bacterium]
MTRYAIDKTRVTAVVLLLLVVGGWLAFRSLPRAEDPGFIVRNALVTTFFPGASPDRVEKLVTDPLEKAIQEIPEIESVTSTSRTGISVINVAVKEQYKKMRPIWDALRRKVEREAAKLPAGVRKPQVNDEYGDVFGIVLGLSGDGLSYAELKQIADDARDALLALGDAAKVEIYGAQDERVFVEYDAARLAEVGLSPAKLRSILEKQNIVIPGGSLHHGKERVAIEPSGNFDSVAAIGKTVIELPGKDGKVVYLRDLVRIRRATVDPAKDKVSLGDGAKLRAMAGRFAVRCQRDAQCGTRGRCVAIAAPNNNNKRNGDERRCAPQVSELVLAISLRAGGNVIELGKQVKATMAKIEAGTPVGVTLGVVNFQPKDVQDVVSGFTSSLLQAIAVVMASMILFLGLRTGLVVSALIPTAMMASLLVMSVLGVGLDQISLAALIIALGMLVDNAVVMAEATLVRMEQGIEAKAAAIASAQELRVPLLTSSLTTSAAFLPIFMAKSAVGEYTASLFIVVTIALLSSWVLSLTMTPLLCAKLLKVSPKKRDADETRDGFQSRFYRGYRRGLLLFVRRPLVTLAIVAVALFGAVKGFSKVPKLFFPPSDRPTFTAEVELQTGAAIEETQRVVRRIEALVERELRASKTRPDGVSTWASYIGKGAPKFYLGYNPESPRSSYAIMVMTASSYQAMPKIMQRLRTRVAELMPQVQVTVRPRQTGPPVKYPVQVRLVGKDTTSLLRLAEQVKTQLRSVPGAVGVNDDWGLRGKKVVIDVDQARARRAGVSSQDVAVSLQTLFSGLEVTQYREGNKVIPVVLRAQLRDRDDVEKIATLGIFAQATGRSVPLAQIADVRLAYEPAKRIRYNRAQAITVNANLAQGALASKVNAAIVPWLEKQKQSWPLGTRYELAGEAESSKKGNKSINEQMPIAAGIIILLLVLQFNSIRRPLIILITLPLGLIGVVLGLLGAGSYFGFMTLLGVVSLFGIVINNAIVLLDRVKIEIEENGCSPAHAIICAAQQRLRPILLTTFTTVAGLFPLWLGGGPMWEPMAISIIFGLSFATVLTLGVVPALYCLLFRVSFKGYRYDG